MEVLNWENSDGMVDMSEEREAEILRNSDYLISVAFQRLSGEDCYLYDDDNSLRLLKFAVMERRRAHLLQTGKMQVFDYRPRTLDSVSHLG